LFGSFIHFLAGKYLAFNNVARFPELGFLDRLPLEKFEDDLITRIVEFESIAKFLLPLVFL